MRLFEATELLKAIDEDLEVESGAATSKKCGISVWSSGGENELVQSVLRFAPGYYD